jgi:hypothetical protein
VLELPRNFDRSNAEHFARLLLVNAKMGRVKAPNLILVAIAWTFEIIPHAPDELHGTYSLLRMTIGTAARKEPERLRQVGHELGHVIQDVVGLSEPHSEEFTERIRLAASMPPWAIRPLLEGGASLDQLAAAFPLCSVEELVLRAVMLPTNRRFPKRTKAAQARLAAVAGVGVRGPSRGC